MDSLWKNLGSMGSLGLGAEEVTGDNPGDLAMEVVAASEVEESAIIQALESSIGQQEKENNNVDARLTKCQEKQVQLESRYRSLQTRLNNLRMRKLAQNSAHQIQTVLSHCENRVQRLKGEQSPPSVKQGPLSVAKLTTGSGQQIGSSFGATQASASESGQPIGSSPIKQETELEVAVGESGQSPDAALVKSDPAGLARKRKKRRRMLTRTRIDRKLGQLNSQLKHVQKFIDPDATESSSGGESCDEEEMGYQPGAELYTANLEERAKYRWLVKRSEYAAQWVWLQGQISDLEYKIRQQAEIFRMQRRNKTPIVLGSDPGLTSAGHPASRSIDSYKGTGIDSRMKKSVEFMSMGRQQEPESSGQSSQDEEESTMTCSRVRPLVKYSRRKILDTYHSNHINSKALKPSMLTCSCANHDQWCILCLGKRPCTTAMDVASQSRQERTSLMDPSYHSVLSDAKSEVSLSLALMEGAINRKWMSRGRLLPSGAKSLARTASNIPAPAHIRCVKNINQKERKVVAKPCRTGRDEGVPTAGKKRAARRKPSDTKDVDGRKDLKDASKQNNKSRPGSPEGVVSHTVKEVKIKEVRDVPRIRDTTTLSEMKRKRKNNYDIDHIVIPYSMAAATRVEKLRYKEIKTPSWREVDEPYAWPPPGVTSRRGPGKRPNPQRPTERDPDFEDISEISMAIMHAKAEEKERIRWATPLGRVHGGQRQRGPRGRRLDSCRTEASSGANTPDPLSPGAIDKVEDIVVATRPTSPQNDPATPCVPSPTVGSKPSTQPTTPVTHSSQQPSTTSTAAGLTSSAAGSTGKLVDSPAATSQLTVSIPGSLLAIGSTPTTPSPQPVGPVPNSPQPACATPLTILPAGVRNRRRTSSTRNRDRNPSEPGLESRSMSPWTEVDEPSIPPYEMRQFPLTDEESLLLEEEDRVKMGPPPPPQDEARSEQSSRTTSRSNSECEDDPDWKDDHDAPWVEEARGGS